MRVCTICTHPQRHEIDLCLVEGVHSLNTLSKKYGLGRNSLARHKAMHLVDKLAAAQTRRGAEGDECLNQLLKLNTEMWSIFDSAKKGGAYALSINAGNQIKENIKLQSQLLGRLNTAPTVNLLVNSDFQRVIGVIVKSLEHFPAARQHLIGVLSGGDHPLLPAHPVDDELLVDEGDN